MIIILLQDKDKKPIPRFHYSIKKGRRISLGNTSHDLISLGYPYEQDILKDFSLPFWQHIWITNIAIKMIACSTLSFKKLWLESSYFWSNVGCKRYSYIEET